MGVMARKMGEQFVITSDRSTDGGPSNRVQKRMSTTYQVWTGDRWSAETTDAKTFTTLDIADEYMRAEYAQVMK